ncbi:FG-GAP-like repeat-containing protein [Desulfosarcina sp. OttesenSCG-928-A07]|nr:FG-GAP-like repeat-containing protein [Desulfosarcina sp. OttesenSCG-928-A07]
MDLYLNAGRNASNDANSNESRIYFNTGKGMLQALPTYVTGDSTNIPTNLAGTISLATDWNHDGSMDVIEIASTTSATTSFTNLYINGGSGRAWTFKQLSSTTHVTGAVLADTNWDGALDLVLTRSGSNAAVVIENTNAVKQGTSLHLKIIDENGFNVFYGNTVQLYDSGGNLISAQVLNPQSGIGTNDSTGMVHFYNLNPTETYTVKMFTAGGEINESVNASWGALSPAESSSYVLSAASDTANSTTSFVGTGYNDTFFATVGTNTYNGGGGWTQPVDAEGTAWVASGGMDIVDFKLATKAVTVDLSSTNSQNTGFNTATFINIEGVRGSGYDDVFTGSSLDNVFEGRGGDDTFHLQTGGGHDTLVYNTLNGYESDARGGCGEDTVYSFIIGDVGINPDADVIDLRGLLSNYLGTATVYWDADANGFGKGAYLLDHASRPLADYFLNVELDGNGNTLIQVDRNGGGNFETVLVLQGVEADLPTLLVNNQLLVASSSVSEAVTINKLHVYEGNTIVLTGTAPVNFETGAELAVIINGITYGGNDIVWDPLNHTWMLRLPAEDAAALGTGTYDVMAMIRLPDGRMVGQDFTRNELTIEALPETSGKVVGENMNIQSYGMAVGDVNGDGLWDYYCGTGIYASVASSEFDTQVFNGLILFNVSTGNTGIGRADSAIFVDFMNDGKMHILLNESVWQDGMTYFKNETGTDGVLQFSQETPGRVGNSNWHGAVVALDLDGDGTLDMVYGDKAPDDGIYWLNNANGIYDSVIASRPTQATPPAATTAQNKNSIFLVQGTDEAGTANVINYGTYGNGQTGSAGTYQIGAEVGAFDMNGDGLIDLVGGVAATSTALRSSFSVRFATTDVNGNYVSPLANNTTVVHNSGVLHYVAESGTNNLMQYVQSIAVADYNNDGKLDLFTGQSTYTTDGTVNSSRLWLGDGAGKVGDNGTPNWTGGDTVKGGVLLPTDWNMDGKIDVFEFAANASTSATLNTGSKFTLWTNTASNNSVGFTSTTLDVSSLTNHIISAIAIDLDYDGDRDLILSANGSDVVYKNNNTIADGTCIHLKIVNMEGHNVFMSHTVHLFDSNGKLVATRVVNPQYGYGTSDSTAVVDFYGLDAGKTYSAVLVKTDGSYGGVSVNGGYHTITGDADLIGTGVLSNVAQFTENTAWSALTAGNGKNASYVLSAESDTGSHNGAFVGTGYNDTFIATLGNDTYNGSGGWSFYAAPDGHWSSTGGVDIIDYQLFSTGMTFNMAEGKTYLGGTVKDTFINVEGIAGTSGNDTFITDGKTNNFFEGRGGADIFKLADGGNDTLMYKLLKGATDGTGGNDHDQVYDFTVGLFDATMDADRIDLSDLLNLKNEKTGFADLVDTILARYVGGKAELNEDAKDIENYVTTVVDASGHTTIKVDLDGTGSQFGMTDLITLNNVETDLATLLANQQLTLF